MKLELIHGCYTETVLIDNKIINNCLLKVIKEALYKAVKKIKNREDLIELLQECIELAGKEDSEGYQCEECGEWNYTKTLKV